MNSKTIPPIDPEGQVLVDCLHRLGEKPAEAYNTVQAVRSMSADNIIHEIRTFGTSIDAKIDVQNAKIDAQGAKVDSKIDAQGAKLDSKIDAQNAKIDVQSAKIDSQGARLESKIESQDAKIESLRWMLGVVIGLLTLLALLGFFAFVGRAEPASDPCAHAESQQVLVQPETSASESPEPTSEPPKARTESRPDRPAASEEARRAVGAQPQEDTLE